MSIWDNLSKRFDVDSDEIRYTHPNNVSVGFSPGYAGINYKDKFSIDTDNKSSINFDGGSVSHDPEYGVRADFQGFGGNVAVTDDKISYRPSGFGRTGAELSIDKWGDIGFKGSPLKGTKVDTYLNDMLDEATGEFQEKVLDDQFRVEANVDTTNLAQAVLGQGTLDNVISGRVVSTGKDQVGFDFTKWQPVIGNKTLFEHGKSVVDEGLYPFTDLEGYRNTKDYKNMDESHWFKKLYEPAAAALGFTPIVNKNASYENLEDVFSGFQLNDKDDRYHDHIMRQAGIDPNNFLPDRSFKYENGVPSYTQNKDATSFTISPDAFDYVSPNLSVSSDGTFNLESDNGDYALSNKGFKFKKFIVGHDGNWSYTPSDNIVLSEEGLFAGGFGKAPSSGTVWQEGDPVNTDLGLSLYGNTGNIITNPNQLTTDQIKEFKKLMGNI
jgi:hypothetical protein